MIPTLSRLDLTRRQWLARAPAALASLGSGLGWQRAAARTLQVPLKQVALENVVRVDMAGSKGWLARNSDGQLWHVLENGSTQLLGSGLAPDGPLDARHGRIAARGADGRLWVRIDAASRSAPERSSALLAPNGGLCGLPLAVIGLIEQDGRTLVARFEPDARGVWQLAARSEEAVLPDTVPVVVDLDGSGDGGHIAVLAGPDRHRYPHAVLGDDVEATQVLWLERHSLRLLRGLRLDTPEVFEDRHLRPWRLPDGRTGLVTVRSGPAGAQLAVVAASPHANSALEIAAAGPYIGTRNRWLSPASVEPTDAGLWAVHTPHIGGVLHRYRAAGVILSADRIASDLTNHRIGTRELDISARLGKRLLLPAQNWQQVNVFDLEGQTSVWSFPTDTPVVQLVAAPGGQAVGIRTQSGLSICTARSIVAGPPKDCK